VARCVSLGGCLATPSPVTLPCNSLTFFQGEVANELMIICDLIEACGNAPNEDWPGENNKTNQNFPFLFFSFWQTVLFYLNTAIRQVIDVSHSVRREMAAIPIRFNRLTTTHNKMENHRLPFSIDIRHNSHTKQTTELPGFLWHKFRIVQLKLTRNFFHPTDCVIVVVKATKSPFILFVVLFAFD
jgi:hypothetical protein